MENQPQNDDKFRSIQSVGSPVRSTMSYKFQRLREKIRQAIESGELSGKLPGERVLARRFHVNAKTLSKALTDLAAEGVLNRSIGRGTYVRGAEPAQNTSECHLILTDKLARHTYGPLIDRLVGQTPDSQTLDTAQLREVRPSFLQQFSAVIDIASDTPEAFLRDLVVRNIPVVVVGREPRTLSINCVLADQQLGIFRAARQLLLGGHRRLGIVEPVGSMTTCQAVRKIASRFADDVAVEACLSSDVPALLRHETTAFICTDLASATAVRTQLEREGADVPANVSLVAIGYLDGQEEARISGYYITLDQMAEAVTKLLNGLASNTRPTTLWLAGEFVDHGTATPTSITPRFGPAQSFSGIGV